MWKLAVAVFGLFLFISCPGYAQEEFISSKVHGRKIESSWDNDLWLKTDRYFTNGLQVKYTDPRISNGNLFNRKSRRSTASVFLRHDIYTPARFNQVDQNFDRPFASYLLSGFQVHLFDHINRVRISHTIQAGLHGRYSGGKTLQNGIHKLLPTSDVINDWQYQLSTDFILSYIWSYEKNIVANDILMLNATGDIAIGTPQTFLEPGIQFRLGQFNEYFKQHDEDGLNDWKYFWYLKGSYRLKVLDTTIHGGVFSHENPWTSFNFNQNLVQAQSGFYVSYLGYALDFSINYISKEIPQGKDHAWGSITFIYLF